jgi:hypothetical protein
MPGIDLHAASECRETVTALPALRALRLLMDRTDHQLPPRSKRGRYPPRATHVNVTCHAVPYTLHTDRMRDQQRTAHTCSVCARQLLPDCSQASSSQRNGAAPASRCRNTRGMERLSPLHHAAAHYLPCRRTPSPLSTRRPATTALPGTHAVWQLQPGAAHSTRRAPHLAGPPEAPTQRTTPYCLSSHHHQVAPPAGRSGPTQPHGAPAAPHGAGPPPQARLPATRPAQPEASQPASQKLQQLQPSHPTTTASSCSRAAWPHIHLHSARAPR